MRLPVVPQIGTKDGTSNKNARLTNCLMESTKRGDKAVVRPGLELRATAEEGYGGGLTVFDGEMVSVYGTTVGILTMSGSGAYGDWTIVPLAYYEQAAYAASVFMVTDGDTFYTSPDGLTWTTKNAPGSPGTYVIVGGGSSFCATRWQDGSIYVSEDAGSSWSLAQTLTGDAPFVVHPFFVNGYFFLNVEDAFGDLALWRSSSGSSWTKTTNYPPYTYQASMFAGDGAGTLVAVRGDEWSAVSTDDGDTWALSTGVGAYAANWIAYGNGIFLVPGSLDSAVSSDGVSFFATGAGPADVYGITFDGDNFVVTRFPGGDYAISPDGYNWTEYLDGSGAVYALSPFSANGTTIANDYPTGLLVLNVITSSIASLGTVAQGSYDFA